MRRFVGVACLVWVAGLTPVARADEPCPPIDVYTGPAVGGSPMGVNANGLCDDFEGTDLRIVTPGASYLSVRYLIEYSNVDAMYVTLDGLGFQNKTFLAYRMYPSGGYDTGMREIPGGPLSTLAPGGVTVRVQAPGGVVTTRYRTVTSLS